MQKLKLKNMTQEMTVYNTAKKRNTIKFTRVSNKKAQYDKDKAAYDKLVAIKAEDAALKLSMKLRVAKIQCKT